ncbi:hypothetical protein ACFQL1_14440 [Halomicroarcula sp. GCM10025709]|uniref:DUF7285 family protein n=1 Tax=Halomicroarcula sp. GCM10025709 TaxID=3252669 RepID=UPI0036139784
MLDEALAGVETDRNRAAPTADLIERNRSTAGIFDPSGLANSLTALPDGYSGNVTVRAGGDGPPDRRRQRTVIASDGR